MIYTIYFYYLLELILILINKIRQSQWFLLRCNKSLITLMKMILWKLLKVQQEAVIQERVKKSVLVNLSSPDCMIFDPIVIPEYKHITVEYSNGKEILIMIGLD